MYRLRVRLHGHRVSFEPPQHLATLSIEREVDGSVLEVMTASAEEVDDGLAVLRRLPTSAPAAGTENEPHITPGIAAAYLTNLPLVTEIDLTNLPAELKRSSTSSIETLKFEPGERYRVTLVSEVILLGSIVAE